MTLNNKRVLIVNYEFPPLGGGGGVAAHKLARGFIFLGYEVDYITTWFDGLERKEMVDGINVYRVKVLHRKYLSHASLISLLTFPLCAYRLASKLCRENEYSFINTHFAIPSGPLGLVLSKKFKVANILSILGGDIFDPTKKLSPHKSWFLRKIVALVINNATRVIAESSDIKNNAFKYYNLKRSIDVIPLAYETIPFHPITRHDLSMGDDNKYLISVGRLVKRKGFDFLISALPALAVNINLLIIGDGPERKNLEFLIQSLNLQDRVKLLGHLSEERKFQYLNVSDLYILSSMHEGFGIVLQEAMQVGLPIISTDNGGQIDFIEEQKNGLLIEHGNEQQLVEKIKTLFQDTQLYNFMVASNKEKIKIYHPKFIAGLYEKTLKN